MVPISGNRLTGEISRIPTSKKGEESPFCPKTFPTMVPSTGRTPCAACHRSRSSSRPSVTDRLRLTGRFSRAVKTPAGTRFPASARPGEAVLPPVPVAPRRHRVPWAPGVHAGTYARVTVHHRSPVSRSTTAPGRAASCLPSDRPRGEGHRAPDTALGSRARPAQAPRGHGPAGPCALAASGDQRVPDSAHRPAGNPGGRTSAAHRRRRRRAAVRPTGPPMTRPRPDPGPLHGRAAVDRPSEAQKGAAPGPKSRGSPGGETLRRVTPPCSGSGPRHRPPARSAERPAVPTSPHRGR